MNRTFMETKMYKFLIVIVLCTTAFSSSLYAQIDVSGVVTDDAGTVLSGVSVQVTGTANGTKTRSAEHTSELQSLMRNTYAVFLSIQNKTNKNKSTQKV